MIVKYTSLVGVLGAVLGCLFVQQAVAQSDVAAMLAKPVCTEQSPCSSPVGNWLTIDDKTHQPRGVVHTFESKNAEGHVTLMGASKFGFYIQGMDWSKTYTGSYEPFHGKKFGAFPIMWDYVDQGNGKWGDGKIFDSDNSKLYKSFVQLQDHGNQLKVSGCIVFFCRGQVWTRLNQEQYDYYHQKSEQDIKDYPMNS